MINVVKENNRILLEDKKNNKVLNISKANNNDLYINLGDKKIKNREYFVITEEDIDLFNLFKITYDKIVNSYNNSKIKSYIDNYYPLVNDNIISWYSDDFYINKASLLNIGYLDNKIIIEIIPGNVEGKITKTVRVRNKGSRYADYSKSFENIYNILEHNDFISKNEENDYNKILVLNNKS